MIAGHATAQTAPPRDPRTIVLDMLQSPDPKQQAWGAWYAGRDQIPDLVPAIIAVVAQHQHGSTTAEHGATDIALDALIQLHATVPPDLIASLVEQRPVHALILASLDENVRGEDADAAERENTSADEALLDLLRRPAHGEKEGEPWYAAANLLLERRPQGFGRALLTDTHIRVTVYVSDDGLHGGGGGSMTSIIGCGGANSNTELPPWAAYELTRFAHRGSVVLAAGPVPMYYLRTLSPAGLTPSAHLARTSGPSTHERFQYIAAAARLDKDAMPIRDDESHSLKWQGAAALNVALQGIRADVQRRFAKILRAMVDAKALTRDEAATIQPTIEVVVEDVRGDRSVTLQ